MDMNSLENRGSEVNYFYLAFDPDHGLGARGQKPCAGRPGPRTETDAEI